MDYNRDNYNRLSKLSSYLDDLTLSQRKDLNNYINQHIKNRNKGKPMIPPLEDVIPFPIWVNQKPQEFIEALLDYVSGIYGEHGQRFKGENYTPPQSPRGGSIKKTYKGKLYKIRMGPNGGKYILVNKVKHYV